MSKQRRWIKKRNRAMRKALKMQQDAEQEAHEFAHEITRSFEQLYRYSEIGLFPHRLLERMLTGVIDLVKKG